MQIKSLLGLSLLAAGLLFTGCNSPFRGFTDNGNDMFYKFHERNECDAKVTVGDMVTFVMRTYDKDTVYDEPYPVVRHRVESSVYAGDIYEALLMMCEGDSATFIFSVDSLNQYYGRNLEGVYRGKYLYVDILVKEVFTAAMQQAEQDSLILVEQDFLDKYLTEKMVGYTEAAPGVFFIETVRGRGPQVKDTSIISVKLIGTTLDGTVFFPEEEDNLDFRLADETGIPFNWNEVLRQMREGSKVTIVLSSPNAFGKGGYDRGLVKPFQSVKLEVEIRKVAATPQEFEAYSIREYVRKHDIKERPGSGGLYHIVLQPGTGDLLKSNDKVMVHYTGYYIDNMQPFDSSVRYGQPFEVVIDESDVIKGWHQALKRMRVGEKARLIIPSELGYGQNGYPPYIGPYAPLIFDIEVVSKN
jgi:FKBP-type peptidyl-prolyl cis-trans isomerase